jgi:RNA polymerase sigma-70 factor (ECF subfamily)
VLKSDARQKFAEALIAHLPALRRYAMALTGNAAGADDLVQDCIERALRQYEDLRDRQRIAGWLRSILHNLYIDELRRRRSRGVEEDIANLIDDGALSVPAGDPGSYRDFVAAMNTISVEHRQILLLVGLEGLNYREISEELKIPLGTVMSRLARARERLRAALEGAGSMPPNVAVLTQHRRGER